MNKIYKVIYNRTLGRYEVVSELAKNRGKVSSSSTGQRIVGLRGAVLGLVISVLLTGAVASAETVHDGDTVVGGDNILISRNADNEILVSAPDIATNKSDIATNKADIATNKSDIATNKADIATNKSNIATNKADIATNKSDIATNKTDIAANKTDIAANKTAIETNKADIAANKTAIETNKADIATNKSDIATNKSDIAANKAAINELTDLTDELGLDKSKPGVKYFRANSTAPDASATGSDAVAVGPSALAAGSNAVAAGSLSAALANNSTAAGYHAWTSATAVNSVAIGSYAISGAVAGMNADEGSSSVIVGGGQNSVAIGSSAQARGNSAIAVGDGAVVMNNGSDGTLTTNSIAVGTNARTVDSNAIAIGNQAKVSLGGESAVALGNGASASSEKALAIGADSVAANGATMASGANAQATGANALAIGNTALAGGGNAIAMGMESVASGGNAVAIGSGAAVAAKDSIAMGTKAGLGMAGDVAGTKGSHVVIGNEAGQNVDGSQDIAIGYKSGGNVKSDYNIAIGSEAGTNIGTSSGQAAVGKNVSIGYHANKYDTATSVMQSTAIGGETQATDDAVALGWSARATGNGAVAAGFNALAADSASLALGQNAQAYDGNVAIGNGSVADTSLLAGTGYLTGQAAPSGVVSVGNSATGTLRRISNVADGAQDQDAATVAQLKKSIDATVAQINSSISVATNSDVKYDSVGSGVGDSITLRNTDGNNTLIHNVAEGSLDTDAVNVGQLKTYVENSRTHYYSVNSSSVNNYNNDGASGSDALAAGVTVKAVGDRSVAAGNNAEAQSLGSIALGTGYDPGNTGSMIQTVAASGYNYNTAIGAGAQSEGNNSLAIGTRAVTALKDANPTVDQAVAIGYFSVASADKAIAFGSEATSNSTSATAIGDSAQALGVNALAVGTNAKATGESSGAIGTGNTVTGGNTYVIGSNNAAVSGSTGVGGKDISAVDSGVFGNRNDVSGVSNRVIGNQNTVAQATAKELRDIVVAGNNNVVSGDTDEDTKNDAGVVKGITVTGSDNEIYAKNRTGKEDLTNISVIGNANKIDTSNTSLDLSDTQILGSNVTATMGNSVYLGSGSGYVTDSASTKGMSTYNSHGTYQFAGGTPAGVVTVGAVGQERRIQNVAAGLVSASSTDAVNGSQLYTMTRPLRFGGDNSTIGASSDADVNVIKRGSDQAMLILGGADSGNLSDNNIGIVSNGTDTLEVKLNKDIDLGEDGSLTIGDTVVNGDSVTAANVNATTVNATTVVAGDTTVNSDGLTIQGGPSVTKAGIDAGGSKITNVAAGTDDTDAVNVSQLKDVAQVASAHTTVTVDGQEADVTEGNLLLTKSTNANGGDNYDLRLNDQINLGGPGKDGADGKDGHIGVNGADGKSGVGIDGKDGISVKGADGKDGVTIKGIDGANGTEGHIGIAGRDGKDADITVGRGYDGARGEKGANGVDGLGGADGITRIIYQDPDGTEHQVATMDDGMKYGGDFGSSSAVKLNNQVNVVGGAASEAGLTDGNIGVVSGQDGDNGKLEVKLNKDIDLGEDGSLTIGDTVVNGDSVTAANVNATTVNATTVNATTVVAGDTTVNSDGLTIQGGPSVTKAGIDAGGSKITNVAAGEISANSKDAVNGSQLFAMNQNVENNTKNINKLGNRLSKVGAGAAALAALHPMDFDPDDKWNVAAGVGSYKDKQAAAIGAFYRPDENTMFSIGGTVGNGENMVNAGVTFALDRRSHVSRSRTAMAKDLLDMQTRMLAMQAQMDKMANIIGLLNHADADSVMFPDVPENHWAYEYIEGLQKRGIIEGYPDGDFKGDRSLTRYEYAAMLYRALMKGEQLDARAAAEFAPELGRIRVDRIAGKDEDRNKIERVRVNDQPGKEKDVYGNRR